MTDKQPEALRLADAWDSAISTRAHVDAGLAMAAELRRLHAMTQRQPLTDAQIIEIYASTGGLDFYLNFARAIEAAHGITGEKK